MDWEAQLGGAGKEGKTGSWESHLFSKHLLITDDVPGKYRHKFWGNCPWEVSRLVGELDQYIV